MSNQGSKETSFDDVKQAELASIKKTAAEAEGDSKQDNLKDNLIGLAFSGGGIRSATVNLGVLQGLAKKEGLLGKFDYLSTVSGGGYIGAWFSALIHRSTNSEQSAAEALSQIELELKASVATKQSTAEVSTQESTNVKTAINWLRSYSNYLTPNTGLSIDSLSAAAYWMTNMVFNQVLLFAFLTLLLLIIMMLVSPLIFSDTFTGSTFLTNDKGPLGQALTAPETLLAELQLWATYLQLKYTYFFSLHPIKFSITYGSGILAYLMTLSVFFPKWKVSILLKKIIHTLLVTPLKLLKKITNTLLVGPIKKLSSHNSFFNVFMSDFIKELNDFIKELKFEHYLIAALFTISISFYNNLIIDNYGAYEPLISPIAPMSIASGWLFVPLQAVIYFTIAITFIKPAKLPPKVSENIYRVIAYAWTLAIIVFTLLFSAVYVPSFFYCHVENSVDVTKELKSLNVSLKEINYKQLQIKDFQKPDINLQALPANATNKTAIDPIKLGAATEKAQALLNHIKVIKRVCNVNLSSNLKNMLPEGYLSLSGSDITISSLVAWLISLLFAKLSNNEKSNPRFTRTLRKFAPYVVISLIFTAASYLSYIIYQSQNFWFWLHFLTAVTIVGSLLLDINTYSLHGFYRNRLTRAYLGASNKNRGAFPFSNTDDIHFKELKAQRPLPIINTTLNLSNSGHLAEQHRQGASFFFTPLYSGFDILGAQRRTGFIETDHYIYDDGPRIGGLIAVSGAAASPNMGYHTNKVMGFIMTIFNARLGRWVGNPNIPETTKKSGPSRNLFYLICELFTTTKSTSNYLYLSDGGHFENLGIYELVRRQCKVIVSVDAGKDDAYLFEDLGNAIRKCKVDFNASIDIDVSNLHPNIDSEYGDFKHSASHLAIGTIQYANGSNGILIYIKNSLSGNEPADLINYKLQQKDFPHRTTSDQFFDEPEFESYRRLGEHMTDESIAIIHKITDGVAQVRKGKLKERDFQSLLKEVYEQTSCRRKKRSV